MDYQYSDSKEINTTPEDTQRYAIHSDQLGTPQAITDATQRVVWLARYDAFGKAQTQGMPRSQVVAHNGSNKTFSWIGTAHASTAEGAGSEKPFEFNLRFAGQYEDAETGWHYNWHRFYDPETGRYLTSDPIGLKGGANAYGYVGGDPFGAVDPWGLSSISANGTTTFQTGLADLPTFAITTQPGWTDYGNSNLLYHQYNQAVTASNISSTQIDALGAYILAHPTPASTSQPATVAGQYNPATPNCGPFSGVFANLVSPDDVYTYTRTGLSGRTYVINITAQNHSLGSGIVIRGVRSDGNGGAYFDNYGEGAGLAQSSINPARNPAINNIWYWATETALENVTGRPYSVRGRDWTESGSTANNSCGC